MQDDLYSDQGMGDSAQPAAKPDAGEDKPAGDADSQQAILPRSILAGKEFKVGDEVVLKITSMRDQDISVAYAPEKAEGEEQPKEGEEEEPVAGEENAGTQAEIPEGASAGKSDSLYD